MDSLSSSSGLSKRARAYNNGTQVASCLVDGCNSDLSKCRDYHRRHKVCEVHSKTPTVTIRGQEQRFCQQCSRFHSLVEFDEEKRSCRKRLDGHNRRRRKSQPESFSLNSGRFFPSQQGTRILPFSGPQIFLTTPVMSSAWDNTLKAQNDSVHYNGQSQLNFMNQKNSVIGSVSQSYGGGKQFPFLRGTDSTLPESSVYQPLDVIPKSEGSSQKMFPHEPNRVINSDRALSLLSSPSAGSRGIGLSHMVHPHAATSAQSLIPARANYNPSGLDGLPMGYGSAANGTGSSDSYCQGMFSIEPDGSSASGSHQTHSFSWD